jgi:regulator of protease activity HflC (stomatin/prohibitin superfamily)
LIVISIAVLAKSVRIIGQAEVMVIERLGASIASRAPASTS